MRKLTLSLVMGGAVFIGASCDHIDPRGKKRTQSPEEIAIEDQNLERTGGGDAEGYQDGEQNKFFRTGTQYIYAVSKTVEVTGAALRAASDYENIKSKFYTDSSANEENLQTWASAVTAYSAVASSACQLFLAKEEVQAMSLTEMADHLALRAFVDQVAGDAAKAEAVAVAASLADEAQQRQATCMTLVAHGNILF